MRLILGWWLISCCMLKKMCLKKWWEISTWVDLKVMNEC